MVSMGKNDQGRVSSSGLASFSTFSGHRSVEAVLCAWPWDN